MREVLDMVNEMNEAIKQMAESSRLEARIKEEKRSSFLNGIMLGVAVQLVITFIAMVMGRI